MKRVLVLKYLVVKALATPPPEYLAEMMKKWSEQERGKFIRDFQNLYAAQIEQLRRIGLWDEMERRERDFMQSAPTAATQQALLDVTWLAESAVCLLWALGYVAELPPYDQEADPKEMNALPQQTLKLLVENAKLRPAQAITKQRNLAELRHWRSRTRQLQESGRTPRELPAGLTIDQIIQMTAAKAAENGDLPAPIGNDFPAFNKPYRELTPRRVFASNLNCDGAPPCFQLALRLRPRQQVGGYSHRDVVLQVRPLCKASVARTCFLGPRLFRALQAVPTGLVLTVLMGMIRLGW